jgi:ketosteroid isomerase-like protein
MRASRFLPILLLLGLVIVRPLQAANAKAESSKQTDKITAVLHAQADAWNRGDIDGFMQTYAPIDELRFASGDTVTYGWKATLARYKQRYPTPEAMGTLAFTDLTVTEISTDAALVFGHWQLTRAKDQPHGLFTLFLRRTAAGWKIYSDHTSAASP